MLFSDKRLSANGTLSCASCHDPEQSFADRRDRPVGALGQALAFNAPTLLNAALKFRMHWQPGGPTRLVSQHAMVLTNTDPVEMGLSESGLKRLNADAAVLEMLRLAELEPSQERAPDRLTLQQYTVQQLLATYVSSLVCTTAFDQFVFEGRTEALTKQERLGLELFTSAPLHCNRCHQGPLLGGGLRSTTTHFPAIISTDERAGRSTPLNVPSLRQVSTTGPYLFDGSVPTLAEVLELYAGGRFGLSGFSINSEQKQALIAFLHTL